MWKFNSDGSDIGYFCMPHIRLSSSSNCVYPLLYLPDCISACCPHARLMALIWFEQYKNIFPKQNQKPELCNGDALCFPGGTNRCCELFLRDSRTRTVIWNYRRGNEKSCIKIGKSYSNVSQ